VCGFFQEANLLLAEWTSGKIDPQDPAVKGAAQVSKLQRRFDDVSAIDFFQTPARGTAQMRIKDLSALLTGHVSDVKGADDDLENLKGRTWVTRINLFVDRIACGWLIKRFVDQAAAFKLVDGDTYVPKPGEIRFDMYDGEYTHEGDQCTFEVMIQRFRLKDPGLVHLAEVVHDIDLKDEKYGRAETNGFEALLAGLVAAQADDIQRMKEGVPLFENLFTHFRAAICQIGSAPNAPSCFSTFWPWPDLRWSS
jgi:hypothetical protein